MLFDPGKRETLSPMLKLGISQVMQYALLDEIFAAAAWDAKDIAFQGGTSIHVLWNSPRWSEDLDFLVTIDKAREIERVMERARKGIQRKLSLSLPGSEIRLKAPSGPPELRDVIKYEFVWSHANKMGAVKVKAEFFPVEPKHLEGYERVVARQRQDPMVIAMRPELADFDLSDLTVRSLVPAAAPETIYGDKMVALAKRPYTKPRDYFDLWWLSTQLGVAPDDARLYDVARRSADCYLYTDRDLKVGISRLLEQPPSLAADLESNLRIFLPPKIHAHLSRTGGFGDMYRHVMAEAARLAGMLDVHAEPEIVL